jgi:hypothetical protein
MPVADHMTRKTITRLDAAVIVIMPIHQKLEQAAQGK